jgi:hypothetical protein
MGAQIVKVELAPAGDFSRGFPKRPSARENADKRRS